MRDVKDWFVFKRNGQNYLYCSMVCKVCFWCLFLISYFIGENHLEGMLEDDNRFQSIAVLVGGD